MKLLDTGFEPANRLMLFLVNFRERLPASLQRDWLSGDIAVDMNFQFLGKNSNLAPGDVPTVLLYLDATGLIRTNFDRLPNHGARISLRLPEGCSVV